MYFVEDEHFARQLQEELHAYENFKCQNEFTEKDHTNPIDSQLEYTDPTPSIHELFVKFDKKFFWNKLGMVQVLWSNKMTMCAGVCSFESRSGLCKISLSAPLLSLRPRKDLVETLLHEMIHAYLFVTRNFKDREDHGPEFHKHMHRINKEAGTKITVYHTFFHEVEYYQRHIWRCNGPCQKLKPYFGFVRRAINRAPGPSDSWWSQHQNSCGGSFIKISEPEKKPAKSKKSKVPKPEDKHKDIRDFFNTKITSKTNNENRSNVKTLADLKDKPVGGVKMNSGTGTVVLTNKTQNSKAGNNQSSTKNKNPETKDPGRVLLSDSNIKNQPKDTAQNIKDIDSDKVKETVRNVWANKYSNTKPPEIPSPKKMKLNNPQPSKNNSEEFPKSNIKSGSSKEISELKKCPVCNKEILESDMNEHLESCLNCSFENESEDDFSNDIFCESVPCPCCYKWFEEIEMSDHIDECLTLSVLKSEMIS